MWIDEIATEDTLRTWVRHCTAMKLVSTPDGRILWANQAFLNWSKYRLDELTKITWMELSVDDEALKADVVEANHLTAYNPMYTIKKRYRPNGEPGQWGQLTVMRYPLSGDIQCCLCHWEPLRNGNAVAFAAAMETGAELEKRLTEMITEIRAVTNRSDEENWVLSSIRMASRHPRVAIGIGLVAAAMFGSQWALTLLKGMGYLPTPVKVETGDLDAIHGHNHSVAAQQIANVPTYQVAYRAAEITTPAGIRVEFSGAGITSVTMPGGTDRSGFSDGGLRRSGVEAAGGVVGAVDVSGIAGSPAGRDY